VLDPRDHRVHLKCAWCGTTDATVVRLAPDAQDGVARLITDHARKVLCKQCRSETHPAVAAPRDVQERSDRFYAAMDRARRDAE
jgi:hypothetical protein